MLLLIILIGLVLGKQVELNWNITYLEANPDGRSQRRVIGINHKWPPPEVHVQQGDMLVIRATNRLNDEQTTLHAHGFFQNGTNFYDGAASATECGIAPNHTYTYRINATQSGTYWLHSHYMGQYVDGLRTPLISHARKEAYQYDEDRVMMLEAWYHRESRDIKKQLLSTSEEIRTRPFRPYMLVNSKGGPDMGRQTTLKMTPGKTYRLRLINVSGTAMVRFGIEQHQMQVIEVDGVDTEIKTVNSVQLSVGQRTSVLVKAKRNPTHNYIYRADIFTDIQSGVRRATLPFQGLLEYSSNFALFNSSASTVDWKFFQDIDLVPLDKVPAPGVNKWVPLEARTAIYDDRREHLAFNNRTFAPPLVPTLLTALTTGYQAYYPDVYGFKTYPIVLDPLEDVEVAVFNRDPNSHPFHLHGHNFFIITRGTNDQNATNHLDSGKYPMRRDTITVPPNAYVIIRFRADNPGVWLFHCHMEFHKAQGLVLTFVEAPYRINSTLSNIPRDLTENCRAMGIPAQGNALGKAGLDMSDDPRGPFPLLS